MFEIQPIEIVGLVAATLTTASFIPQVYKAWKTKEVEGISLTMFTAMFIGVLLWLIYGYSLKSLSMVIANTVTSVLCFAVLVLKIKYRKK
ncbi:MULTISPECIES: SemiSWEET family sugar transporter [unclassified Algibacter]|uniref:SemiSWEET family sugar transporter n=1 Tax=unclassified Algibacter TaxID=2615009 RepID=UPI00131CA7A0|nr:MULTISPECIES: SemiSWEET transporter [unclassified Algibacter]MCL5126917.1 SemiSWEET transporter [Algibacter sp. L4_22]